MGWYLLTKDMEEVGQICPVCGKPGKAGEAVYLTDEGSVKDPVTGYYLRMGIRHVRCTGEGKVSYI